MVELIPENQPYMPSQHNLITIFSQNTLFALPNLIAAILVALHLFFFPLKAKQVTIENSIYDEMSEEFIKNLLAEDQYYSKEQHLTIIKSRPPETLFKLEHY